MKKQTNLILTLALALMTVFSSYAQTHELKPLFQLFTSSTCPGCNYGNHILDSVLNNNSVEEYALIKYQVQWPGEGDPYYIPAAGDRVSYYGVTSVPALYVATDYMLPWNMTQEIFDENSNDMTSMGITVNNAEITEAGMISVDVELDVDADYAAGLTLQVVVVEKVTVENVGTNGETEFHNVMMHMFPDANGTTLGALSVGNNETFNFTYDMSTTFMEQASDLRVIAFVQDDTDKSIIQSEMVDVTPLFETYSATFNVESCAGLIADATIVMDVCGSGTTDQNGQLTFTGLSNGDYNYEIVAAGLFPVSGSVTISDDNIEEAVVMEIPSSSYYEDFENGIPEGWTPIANSGVGDMVLEYDGTICLFNQGSSGDPLMIVSAPITIAEDGTISFEIGNASPYNPVCGFGYLTDVTDPSTYVELASYNDIPTSGFVQHSFEASSVGLSGDINFAWSHNGGDITGTFFYIDNVSVTGEAPIAEPAYLSYNIEDNTDVILTWSEYTCATVDAFNVYRSFEGADFELIGTTTEVTYPDLDLAVGTYEYYITVVVEGEESVPSGIVSVEILAPPPAPQNLSLELDGFYGVILDWDDYSKGFESYNVYRSVDGADYEVVASDLTESTYADSELDEALYEYYVTAIVDGLESDPSNIVSMLITAMDDVAGNATRIYPNPASDMINITADATILNVNIYNQAGQLVKSQNVNAKSFNQDISELPKGLYMIQLKTVNTIITERIIKQ